MKVQTGYIYHIKDSFFEKVNDKGLMTSKKMGLNLFFTDIDKIKKIMLDELK